MKKPVIYKVQNFQKPSFRLKNYIGQVLRKRQNLEIISFKVERNWLNLKIRNGDKNVIGIRFDTHERTGKKRIHEQRDINITPGWNGVKVVWRNFSDF